MSPGVSSVNESGSDSNGGGDTVYNLKPISNFFIEICRVHPRVKKTWIKKISTLYMKVTEGAGMKLSKSLDYYVAFVKVLTKFVHG